MAERRLRYQVDVEGNAVENLDRLGRKSSSVARSMKDDLDSTASKGKQFAQVLGRMADDIEEDLEGSKRAAAAMARVLGDDLAGEADQIVASFNRAGLSFDEIEQDADELAAAFKRVEDLSQQMGGGIRRGADEAADGLDRVTNNADQSRSVLANMAGNTAQDFGELGGVVGSLGVGVGQLAEYAVDGNIALKNLASVAGPLALLSVAGLTLNAVMAENSKRIERARQVQESYTKALEDSENAQAVTAATAENFINAEVIGRVQRLGVNVRNLASAVTDASIDFETINGPMREFLTQTAEGSVSTDELAAAMDQFGIASSPLTEELMRLAAAGELDIGTLRDLTRTVGELSTGYAASSEEVARNRAITQALGTTTTSTAERIEEATAGLERHTAALEVMNEAQDAARGLELSLAEAMIQTADELDSYIAVMADGTASERERTQAGIDLEQQFYAEAEAAGRMAEQAAIAGGAAAGSAEVIAASNQAQIDSLNRLLANIGPDSPLRAGIISHIQALRDIPTSINTTVRVNTSYGQGTTPLTSRPGAVLHDGGFVPGSTGQEVDTTLQAGEVVLNAAQQRNVAGAIAGGGGGPTQIIVQLDGRVLVDALVRQNRMNGSLPITVQAVS